MNCTRNALQGGTTGIPDTLFSKFWSASTDVSGEQMALGVPLMRMPAVRSESLDPNSWMLCLRDVSFHPQPIRVKLVNMLGAWRHVNLGAVFEGHFTCGPHRERFARCVALDVEECVGA